jgi:hypothetical protein
VASPPYLVVPPHAVAEYFPALRIALPLKESFQYKYSYLNESIPIADQWHYFCCKIESKKATKAFPAAHKYLF